MIYCFESSFCCFFVVGIIYVGYSFIDSFLFLAVSDLVMIFKFLMHDFFLFFSVYSRNFISMIFDNFLNLIFLLVGFAAAAAATGAPLLRFGVGAIHASELIGGKGDIAEE